jgi:NADH:ubiquinone oxidoreductase subunit C
MNLDNFDFELTQLPGAMPVWRARVDADEWRRACRHACEKGGRLVALWGADDRDRERAFTVHAALSVQSGLVIVSLSASGGRFPDVSDIFPAANRMQRAVHDLLGVEAEGAATAASGCGMPPGRGNEFPLRKVLNRVTVSPRVTPLNNQFPFVRVEGGGVHEILAPHAGTIEPGHFRFPSSAQAAG